MFPGKDRLVMRNQCYVYRLQYGSGKGPKVKLINDYPAVLTFLCRLF